MQIVTAPFWITGASVYISSKTRILLWLTAAGIDLLGTWLAHPLPSCRLFSENMEFNADHLLERCRLFQLIAIGEMVFTLGAALRLAPLNWMTFVLGTVTMAEIVSFWALTFGHFNSQITDYIEKTRDPIRISRYAINVLVIILFALIMVSVANEQIILHPFEVPSPVLSFLLGGGPILFLLAQGWYMTTVPNVRPRFIIFCGFLLIFVSIVSCLFPSYISLITVGLVLTAFAILDFH